VPLRLSALVASFNKPKMKLLKTTLFSFFIVLASMAFGQNNHINDIESSAKQFILEQSSEDFTIASAEELLTSKENTQQIIAFQLAPQGFVIISKSNKNILAFSFENNLAPQGTPERELTLDLLNYIANNDSPLGKSDTETEDQIWGPYVYNMWGQVNCSDNTGSTINVNNLFTPSHYAPGCVAVSQSSILMHYTWPPRGMGSSTYTDNQGASRGTCSVDHENTEYDWTNALNRYRNKSSEMIEREAAGTVTYHSAVSLSMDFEYNGSTSNVNRIPSALANHFRFTALYKSRSSSSFWSILDSNMVWAKPAVLAVENSSGGGHSVVCDGLKIEDGDFFYHLNMGWWGTSNGWYKIRTSFNSGGYNYVIGAAMNIIAEPMLVNPVVLDNSPMTDLCWSYPEKAYAEAFEVQRSINGGSWETLTSTVTDTCLTIFPLEGNTYKFRARAQVNNGRWYTNSWSDEVSLVRNYTGIDEQVLEQVKVFPNPIQNELHIQLPLTVKSNSTITIFNELGQVVFERQSNNSADIHINTTLWEKGVYFIQVQNNSSSRTIKSIKL